jgi:predicted secreted protein
VEDQRSRKIVVVSHCILNQNAKVYGLARFAGVVTPLVDFVVKEGLGIFQMPCPETTYLGIRRWSMVKEQYDTPAYRDHCRRLANQVINETEDYERSGYKVVAVIGADGSPTCGVNKTVSQPLGPWGGIRKNVHQRSEMAKAKGVFIETLESEAKKRGIDYVFTGVSDTDTSIEEAIQKLKKLI